MPTFPEIRLCERCWKPIAEGAGCRVGWHADPRHPLLAAPRSFRHLEGDTACSGSQYAETDPEWVQGGGSS